MQDIKKTKILKAKQTEHDTWGIPDVQDKTGDPDKINALGLKRSWRYEPPEESVEEEPVPLTAEEIEEIRQAAYEEGFNQGKEEGFSKGYDEGKAQGHEQGVLEGKEEGLTQGLEQGQEQITQIAQNWQGLVDTLHKPLADVEQNVEQQLLHLVAQLVEAVTAVEAKTNPEILLNAIAEGMKALPANEPNTQVQLNPLDVSVVEAQFGAEYIAEKGWRLLPAPHVEQGSCQIENSTSNIDLTIKSKLKDVLDSFLQQALHQ